VSKLGKLFNKLLAGTSDKSIKFNDLCWLLSNLNFGERIKGSHHIFNKPNIDEIINLQSKGNMAKPYQVKQVRNIILKYKLGESINE